MDTPMAVISGANRGLILGLVENVGLIFVRGDYKDIFAFVVLVLVLIFRPQGLIGERVAERA
jgi:branched-chain amino acid transport system permease protein